MQTHINQERRNVFSFAAPKISEVIIRAARDINILRRDDGQFVSSLKDLKIAVVQSYVKEENSVVDEAVHNVLYKSFHLQPEFERTVEIEYMTRNEITYATNNSGKKGPIYNLVNQKKNEVIVVVFAMLSFSNQYFSR